MLIPLWAALLLLASTLGLSGDQVAGKYVYLTAAASPDAGHVYAGMACDPRFSYGMDYCAGLPDETAILYHWGDEAAGYDIAFERFTLRHEVEHLLRGPDGPEWDINNEAAADVAGCAAAVVTGRC